MGPTVTRLVQDPLAIKLLNIRQYVLNVSGFKVITFIFVIQNEINYLACLSLHVNRLFSYGGG